MASDIKLDGQKIAILIESDYCEPEIWYYRYRFQEEGVEVHFISRLWGQESLTFHGHEYKAPFVCNRSFEDIDDETLRKYSALIIPGGFVADRLRYTEDVTKIPPAALFLKRVFENKQIIKGIICHGMWLLSPVPELVRNRKVTTHANMLGDVRNMGAVFVDQDVVADGDLVTARSADHCYMFARKIINILAGG